MLSYRAYQLSHERTFLPSILHQESDEDAIAEAKKLVRNLPIEVWQGDRRVAKVTPDGQIYLPRAGRFTANVD